MTGGSIYTFLAAGVLALIAALVVVAALLCLQYRARVRAEAAALDGMGHELKLNLQRMLGELMVLDEGAGYAPGMLMDVHHPQLDAVHAALVRCDRRALAVMDNIYQTLQARKLHLRAELEVGRAVSDERGNAIDVTLDGVAMLYLWDIHDGCRPDEARPTRSWAVREWMKTHGFGRFSLPGLHIRDEVVERLRQYGMPLTPRPLTHTAFEYWSLRYDRQRDPRGVFGARRLADEAPDRVEFADAQAEDDGTTRDMADTSPKIVEDVVK